MSIELEKKQECSIAGEKNVCEDRNRKIPRDVITLIFASVGIGIEVCWYTNRQRWVEVLISSKLYAKGMHKDGAAK